MKERYNQWMEYLTQGIHHRKSIRWFRVCLYSILLYQTLILCLPMVDFIWGEHSFMFADSDWHQNSWANKFYMALFSERWSGSYPYLIGLQLIGLVLGLMRKYIRLAGVLVYVTTVLLFNRAFLMITGGNYLIHILLFYFLFINEDGKDKGVNAFLTNVFVWACRLQIVIVYFFSGIYKLRGDIWLSGESLHYLLNMQEFSLPFIVGHVESITPLLTLGTYLALAYQLTFPYLVWVKKIKIPFLMIGVSFHILTIFIMGVPVFGMIMTASYLLFLSDAELERLFYHRKKTIEA